MPLYEYRATDATCHCPFCQPGFEVLEKLTATPTMVCPRCGHTVERVISVPHVVRGEGHRLKETHFSKHGFTQYKKVAKGVYEKTAGKGPSHIADDGK